MPQGGDPARGHPGAACTPGQGERLPREERVRLSWLKKLTGAAHWAADNPETVAQFIKGLQDLLAHRIILVPEAVIDERARDLTLALGGHRLVDLACCCMASGKMIMIGELELDGAPIRALMEIRPKGAGIVWEPGDRRILVEVAGPDFQAKSLPGKAALKGARSRNTCRTSTLS